MDMNIRVSANVMTICAFVLLGFTGNAIAYNNYPEKKCGSCHSNALHRACAGCHRHGTHGKGGFGMTLVAKTNKLVYQPGEKMHITFTGGAIGGWARAYLYNNCDAIGEPIATVTGPGGVGGGPDFSPTIFYVSAPEKPGSYTYSAAWYGNRYDSSSGWFSSEHWRDDPSNPNHGREFVLTNTFTVAPVDAALNKMGSSPTLTTSAVSK